MQERIYFFSRLGFITGALMLLQACGTTRPLPTYEPPMARANFQTVRTTAYTHTEADHLQYGNQNALGGTLHAAAFPSHRSASIAPRALPVRENESSDYEQVAYVRSGPQPFSMDGAPVRRAITTTTTTTRTVTFSANACGSAAADWSRWPAGTVFRILSTGQIYRVEDYGWALAGRNTIDLYMATPNDMNRWGVRNEPIEILVWGDPAESLRRLRSHQDFRHIRRMCLELEGEQSAAAHLQ